MRVVVAGRVLQGLGGGGLDVLSEIIVTDMTTLQERSLYLGLMAIPTALGSVLGPTVGGVFSSLVSWRWIGWINLPLLGISFPLTVVFLKLRSLQHSPLSELRRLDWTGVFLFTAWIILFALPLSWAGNLYAWDSFRTLLPLLFGVTILVAFAFYEGKAITPIMPHRIFKSRTASATLLSVFIHGVSLYSLLQWLPLLYQAIMAKTVLSSAVTLLPTSATSVVAAVGRVTIVGLANIGYRWSIRIAWAFTAAGTGLLVLLDADSTASIAYGLPVIWGAGIGLLLRLLFLPLQASVVRVDDTGLAIGILLTFRLLGGLVGLSICSTIFSSYFLRSLDSIGSLPISLEHLRDPEAAIAFIPQLRALDLPDTILEPIIHAYLTSIRAVVYAMTGFASLGFLSSFFIQELTLEKTEMGQQQFED
ncbi:TRI12 domain containing protein [Pyrenophora tritici-repentis]|nr:TRI12 domain containing protein [Pyrenophora tritici-repentis]